MLEPDRLFNPLDAGTSRGPDWWFTARSAKEIRGNFALDIRTLNARCKRKYRSLRSASIRDQVLKRQERLLNGRMRIALASLLGKRKSSFLFDTLLCVDGSHDARCRSTKPSSRITCGTSRQFSRICSRD
jgi:hypothetical protein